MDRSDNRANQKNSNNKAYWSSRGMEKPSGWQGIYYFYYFSNYLVLSNFLDQPPTAMYLDLKKTILYWLFSKFWGNKLVNSVIMKITQIQRAPLTFYAKFSIFIKSAMILCLNNFPKIFHSIFWIQFKKWNFSMCFDYYDTVINWQQLKCVKQQYYRYGIKYSARIHIIKVRFLNRQLRKVGCQLTKTISQSVSPTVCWS